MKSSTTTTTAATSHSESSSPSSSAAVVASPSPSAGPSDEPSAPSTSASGGGAGGGGDPSTSSVSIERRSPYSALCRWTLPAFPRARARALWSRYFEVGGFDCRLLIYPKGDSQALPGYSSVYLQIVDPRGPSSSSSSRWDCFASYRLSVLHHSDDSKSLSRDSWHRFSSKKKSHGWCDFVPSATLLDPRSGFLSPPTDSIVISADILLLHESLSISSAADDTTGGGKFTWKVHNFTHFRDMIRTQKIMSPVFPAGDCNLRISVYQSSVSGADHLSMCLESKDTDKTLVPPDRTCWCLFRMSVLNQRPAGGAAAAHVHRDSYGRFAADNKGGDNTSLGWNDYMRMSDFLAADAGYLVDDTAVFSTSFHVIRESNSFTKNAMLAASASSAAAGGGRGGGGGAARKSDGHFGKFTWRIENFTRLKDLLKKRKITGLCVKSRRFQIGNRDCRLIVYPRGQSQPPCHLSVFLEVTDSRNTTSDWSCFVSHRLSVVNQKMEEKSVTKESQNRYSKAAKDWGWREFVTLTSLFDQDSGFLVQDTVVFSAEVLILKETSIMQEFGDQDSELGSAGLGSQIDAICKRGSFTWRVENFLSFKEIMETRKIFSKFFQVGGCELRIGVYESFDTICIYLESDQSAGSDPDKNFWVRYRMAVVNQKNPAKTVWKESSICTKTWNNSVLQFMKVSDMLESDAGFLVRDTVVFICEIVDCCPWFDFSDLEVLASENDQDALSTDPDELIDSEDSEGISGDEEDMFRNLLSRAGFHLTYGDNPSQPQVTLREKLLMDAGAIAGFLTGLRVYLDDPAKVKRLLLPTKLSGSNGAKKDATKGDPDSPSLMNLLMGVKVLQQAIIDLLLDIMVECCQPSEIRTGYESSDTSSKPSPDSNGATTPSERSGDGEVSEYGQFRVDQRLESELDELTHAHAVQSSDLNANEAPCKTSSEQLICPPETSAGDLPADDGSIRASKTKWPEQSEELLGLIVNSLRALDNAVPQGCPEPRRRPQSVQKIALVLDKAPSHLQPDLIALVPKLVDHSEHSLAASALLDRLQKPDAEPSLRLPVFGALSQLEFGSEVWERVLFQAFELLSDSNDEPLVAAISYVFKAASQCEHLPEAVRAVRSRLKSLGAEVPQCVLDVLTETVHTWRDVAEALLREIDSDCELDEICMTPPCGVFANGVNELSAEGMNAGEEQVVDGCHHLSDVYILIDMLSIPNLFVEVSQVFERAIVRGTIGLRSVAMVLERRHSRRLSGKSQSVADDSQNKQLLLDGTEPFSIQEDDFTSVLSLGEGLSISRETRVQDFVRMLYAIMFKIYSEEPYRVRMLKGLVDRATNTSDNCRIVDIDMDVLVFLVREEDGIARPVLNMIREIAVLAQVDRATLWHQLCAIENEHVRSQEERQEELSNFAREKAVLTQRIHESEASTSRLKSELKVEMDRSTREKKDLSEQIVDFENQLEWVRSEKDEQISKLSADRKALQDRLHDVEAQLSQLKSRKRDELKRAMKEKNALAERLKNAEAARKRYDDELKRYATEKVTREEVRQSLEDEVRRLTKTVGKTEGEKREKEEQIARCEDYIDGMQSKLHASQQYIINLQNSLEEEMARHAPLYGAGLEELSMKELETISHIHEEGLRQIHAIRQRRGVGGPSLVGAHSLPQVHGVFTTTTVPMMPIGLPPSINPNGLGNQGNGHMGDATGPWFNPS